MISDFSYMVDDPKQEESVPQSPPPKVKGDIDDNNSENVKSMDDSHGWLREQHLVLSPGRDRITVDLEDEENGVTD